MAAAPLASSVLAGARMRTWVILAVFIAFPMAGSRLAFAADAAVGEAGDDGGLDTSSDDGGDDGSSSNIASASQEPLACDGALCDTTNSSTCAIGGNAIGGTPVDSTALALLLSAATIGVARRARRGATRPGCGGQTC